MSVEGGPVDEIVIDDVVSDSLSPVVSSDYNSNVDNNVSESVLDEVPVSVVDTRDNQLDELPSLSPVMDLGSEVDNSQATPSSPVESSFAVPLPPRGSRSSRRDSVRGEGGPPPRSRSRSGQGRRQGTPSPSPGRHRMPPSVAATPPRRVSSS